MSPFPESLLYLVSGGFALVQLGSWLRSRALLSGEAGGLCESIAPPRIEIEPAGSFRIGEFTIDPSRNLVRRLNREQRLEPKAMDVLIALARRPGEVIGREELVNSIWQVKFGSDESLTRAISLVRKIFAGAEDGRKYIETVPKRGYRLAIMPKWNDRAGIRQIGMRARRNISRQIALLPATQR